MRMWMVEPMIMCRQHLLGEHLEIHMFVTHINKGKSIKGYVQSNCVEPGSMHVRHEQLVMDMCRRGYNHYSALPKLKTFILDSDPVWPWQNVVVDTQASLKELLRRCPECAKRFEIYSKRVNWLL